MEISYEEEVADHFEDEGDVHVAACSKCDLELQIIKSDEDIHLDEFC